MKKPKATRKSQSTLQAQPSAGGFLVVGIGASAGGIEALQAFFEQVPAGSGAAYIVILHLSPDHDSQLAQVLQAVTTMPVTQVTEKVKVAPDQVYVIPPNQHLLMEDDHIAVLPNTLIEERRAPVDIFFRTLADTHGPRAVCVVLSGTGANGSMGLRRIKEHGGAAFVQNPREAAYNEMPRNAISTELVDEVLNVAEIPARISSYKASLDTTHIQIESEGRSEGEQQALREIFTQMRLRTGHDFSSYKRPTILRRMERRMSIRNLPDLPAYAAFIHQHPEELIALLKDLLISVTNFFRDKKAFNAVEQDVMPRLFKDKNGESEVRIWIAGCATGEEAYSLAMLCAERISHMPDAPKIQIFATDIDEAAIARARDGYYTINDAADVPPERLRRFFTREGDGYRISREIRETILFAHHNFIKDPPFSRIDLVSCRNVLIYLGAPAQERVMEIFHFALRPGGFLFLGTAESADGAADLYTAFSREQHIYQSKPVKLRVYPVPESVPALPVIQRPPTVPAGNDTKPFKEERITFGELHQRMLEQYAPPSLVVNEEYEIVHTTGRAARYLQMSGGELSRNLFTLIRPELRLELRSALYQATQQGTPVEAHGLKVSIDNHTETVNVHVRPVLKEGDIARGFILIVFEPAALGAGSETRVVTAGQPLAQHLEDELVRLKTQLRGANEQHEFQAEELKASNEELQAMNEELRSAAEELETGKEELQSINEELSTVNQELKVKVEEASIMSNNLQNLINSTNIGTIFLDRSLRVALFTPPARDVFNLIPADRGRPLSDITSRLQANNLAEDADKVLEKLIAIEREVQAGNGMVYLMRLLPYRTDEDHIGGVVITLVDITERKKAEEQVRESEERFRLFVSASSEAIYSMNADWTQMHSLKSIDFLKNTDTPSHSWLLRYIPPEDRREVQTAIQAAINEKKIFEQEHRVTRADGSTGWTFSRAIPLLNERGEIKEWFGAASDITERKHAEEALRESEVRLRITMDNAVDYAIINTDTEGLVEGWSRGAERIFGWSEAEVLGKPADIIFTPEDRAAGAARREIEIAVREGRAPDERWHIRKNGSRFYMSGVMRPIMDGGVLRGFVKVASDLTEQRRAEEFLRVNEERYRIALQSAEMGAWDWNVTEDKTKWSAQHYLLLGLQPGEEDALDAAFFMQFVHPEDLPAVSKELRQAVEESGVYRVDAFRITRADNGEVRWMSGYGRAVSQKDGKATRLVGVMYDVTGRVETTQALRDKQMKLEIAQRAARVGIWGYDLVEQHGIATPEWNELTGYPAPAETYEMNVFLGLVHPEDRDKLEAAHNKAVSGHSPVELEFRLQHPQRGLLWLLKRGQYIPPHDHMNAALMGSLIDITERKQVEQQKDEFIGVASHELRTPVTSIKAYAEILEELFAESGDTQSAGLMRKLDVQVDRLTTLIYALLDTTRIAGGRLELQKVEFAIDELIAETAEPMQRIAGSQQIELRLQANATVYADRERIRQVLINLISNAIKYAPGTERIIVQSAVNDGALSVCVRDYGIGMDETVQQQVFERFFRAGDMGNVSGLGLGLFVSAGIVRQHGGRIWVESQKGEGALFCFTLPLGKQ